MIRRMFELLIVTLTLFGLVYISMSLVEVIKSIQ